MKIGLYKLRYGLYIRLLEFNECSMEEVACYYSANQTDYDI